MSVSRQSVGDPYEFNVIHPLFIDLFCSLIIAITYADVEKIVRIRVGIPFERIHHKHISCRLALPMQLWMACRHKPKNTRTDSYMSNHSSTVSYQSVDDPYQLDVTHPLSTDSSCSFMIAMTYADEGKIVRIRVEIPFERIHYK